MSDATDDLEYRESGEQDRFRQIDKEQWERQIGKSAPSIDSNNTGKLSDIKIVTHSALKDGEFALIQTLPSIDDSLLRKFDLGHLGSIDKHQVQVLATTVTEKAWRNGERYGRVNELEIQRGDAIGGGKAGIVMSYEEVVARIDKLNLKGGE